jgi:hypothetical protein
MAQLFNRTVRVVVGTTLVEGLRVKFTVKKTAKPEPNVGDVTIYNLNEDSRRALKHKGEQVSIEAGYPDTIAQIFSGNASFIDHSHEGADWLTKAQLGDGERAFRWATKSESFKPGTPISYVCQQLAKATGLDVTDATKVLGGLTGQFAQGFAVSGRVLPELTALLKGQAMSSQSRTESYWYSRRVLRCLLRVRFWIPTLA